MREGKNREIKNVLGALGLEVNRLIRISYGPFQLGSLDEGAIQEVKSRTLRDQLGSRLIERAGANFDAPLFDDNNSGKDTKKKPDSPKRQPQRSGDEGRRKPAGKQTREERREQGRERLDTKKRDDKPSKRPPPRSRASNVWMGPGARPMSQKKKDAGAASGDHKARTGKTTKSRPAGAGKPVSKRSPAKGGGRSRHADRRR